MGDSVDTLRRFLDEAFAAGDVRLVMNYRDVPMIDSSAIGVMMKAYTSAKQRGGDVRLVNPSKFVAQTLRLIGVLSLFVIFETEEQAAESFAAL